MIPALIDSFLFVSEWPLEDLSPFQASVSCLPLVPYLDTEDFHFAPMDDMDADADVSDGDWARAELAADFVVDQVQRERRVVIVSRAATNRSPLVAALAIRQLRRCTGDKALSYVKLRHPASLGNSELQTRLGDLERLRP